MIKQNNLYLGKTGEDIAVNYLKSKNYRIVERNFHKRYSEIDIVAIEGNTLVFIEVKTRQGNEFGNPIEAITAFKLRSLVRSAQYYKLLNPKLPDSMRIDFVGVSLTEDEKLKDINLIRNITG